MFGAAPPNDCRSNAPIREELVAKRSFSQTASDVSGSEKPVSCETATTGGSDSPRYSHSVADESPDAEMNRFPGRALSRETSPSWPRQENRNIPVRMSITDIIPLEKPTAIHIPATSTASERIAPCDGDAVFHSRPFELDRLSRKRRVDSLVAAM